MRYPWIIAVVIAALIAVVAAWLIARRRASKKANKAAKILANTVRIEQLPEYKKVRWHYRMMLTLAVILLLPISATMAMMVARFSSITTVIPEVHNRDIMLCMDISFSMYSSNAKILERFKEITAGLTEERVGMMFFDSSAVTVFPLTDDYDYIQERLGFASNAFIDNRAADNRVFLSDGTRVGGGSSKIGDGLASCVLGFDRVGEERARSIIIATDNLAGPDSIVSLMQAAQMAQSYDIRVYGLNPRDAVVTDERYKKFIEEYMQSVVLTGGAYYTFDNVQVVPELVDQIMKQEAARLDGAPIITQKDEPLMLFTISAIATAGLLLLLWRLKI